jgi:DNA mismatch repair ATPase MutL
MQHLKHTIIYRILNKHQIIDYYRYIDDILIIYNEQYTKIENTLNEFNSVHHKIKFTMKKETRNRINYLDMTTIKEHNKITFNIFRKPTTTDSIIHNDSCHFNEHKRSAINYLLNHMNTYPLTQENKDRELTIINEILKNNGYQKQPTNFQTKIKPP